MNIVRKEETPFQKKLGEALWQAVANSCPRKGGQPTFPALDTLEVVAALAANLLASLPPQEADALARVFAENFEDLVKVRRKLSPPGIAFQ